MNLLLALAFASHPASAAPARAAAVKAAYAAVANPRALPRFPAEKLPKPALRDFHRKALRWEPIAPTSHRLPAPGAPVLVVQIFHEEGSAVDLFNRRGSLLASGETGENGLLRWARLVPSTVKNAAERLVRRLENGVPGRSRISKDRLPSEARAQFDSYQGGNPNTATEAHVFSAGAKVYYLIYQPDPWTDNGTDPGNSLFTVFSRDDRRLGSGYAVTGEGTLGWDKNLED